MIGKLSIPGKRELSILLPGLVVGSTEIVRCFRHEGEHCPRCNGSGYRPRRHCAGCGELAGRPSQGGKVLMGLRNRRDREQPFYCLGCHPELGRGPAVLEGMGLMAAPTCSRCGGRHWVRYFSETTDGNFEEAFRLCYCNHNPDAQGKRTREHAREGASSCTLRIVCSFELRF